MDRLCAECKFCKMYYDQHDDECFYCSNDEGRGCSEFDDEACEEFEEEL